MLSVTTDERVKRYEIFTNFERDLRLSSESFPAELSLIESAKEKERKAKAWHNNAFKIAFCVKQEASDINDSV